MQMRPGGLFVATNIRVRDFINMAFRTDPTLLSQQIIDLPPWASTVRYNILARYVPDHDPAVGDTDSGPIVRALLDTRFAFKAHMEKRELPAYLLSVAPTGAKLRPAAAECSDPQNLDKCRTAYGQGRMTGRDMPFAELVREILVVAQRPVLDRTGISGRFDVDLQWNPDDLTDGTDSRPVDFRRGAGVGAEARGQQSARGRACRRSLGASNRRLISDRSVRDGAGASSWGGWHRGARGQYRKRAGRSDPRESDVRGCIH